MQSQLLVAEALENTELHVHGEEQGQSFGQDQCQGQSRWDSAAHRADWRNLITPMKKTGYYLTSAVQPRQVGKNGNVV